MKMNNSNDARNSLLDTISKLKSGRASNLDEVALEIKAFAVLNGLQDRHHEECRINGKTSQKQNAGWGKYAKEESTADQQAKAKAKAERKGLADFSPQLKAIAEKREALSQYDGREKATRDEKAKLDAEEQAIKAQIKELS
mgnify:CR=1 FL=1